MFQWRPDTREAVKSIATDSITANVMVADANLTIVYMNSAVMTLLKEAESDIRKDLPQFNTATLIGSSIDVFHKNPAHQRKLLENLSVTHRATIQVGGRSFDLVATPLTDKAGRRAGIVVEWADAAIRLQNLAFAAQADAIGRAQAVIEFWMDGTVLTANENFLTAMGYALAEIQGKHHSMFVEPAMRDSAAYRQFWEQLNRGEYQAAEYKRVGKGGREVWILASYNPVLDQRGTPFKIVKFATDITQQKLRTADLDGQMSAINRSQAVIEFGMDGTVLAANENFLRTLGYSIEEIQGRHHSMFVDPSERNDAAYREFWAKLNRGEYQAAEYRRIGKGGREVWIQASYNPILDLNGKPFKVVKYATDTTAQAIARMKNEHVRGMMESVAAGAEELNASVREIAEAMMKSKETATTAVGRAEAADEQALRLSTAAESMSGIVQLIGDITGQINLLALNATIESARAGEAGRGFAVVAAEVKSLANQVKQAADRIGAEIQNLSGISGDVIGALDAIKQAIRSVSEYVTSTAAAVEEQSTVTGEMSASMQQAAVEAASIGRSATG
ncbi:MAG: PAS domain-containing protein [Afipia sp.]|nr:PAS domain-containing protein [Afipia sp.]